MSNDIKLRECPCCSYSAVLETMQVRKGWEANIHCNDCGLTIHTITFDFEEEAIEDAVTKWNTRKPMDRIVEQLEELDIDDIDVLQDVAIEIAKGGSNNDNR